MRSQTEEAPSARSFLREFKVPLLLAVSLQLLLAPFTSVPPDTAVWLTTGQRSMAGIGLFQVTGFSYPPIYGYWCMAVGSFSRLFGIGPTSLGGPISGLDRTWQFSGDFLATSPLFTLVAKLPLIAAAMGTSYFIWRIVLSLGGVSTANRNRAKFAFLLWSFSPLVITVASIQGQIDPLVALAITGGLFSALENRWMLSGIFIAFGIGAKLTPGFLIPVLLGFALQTTERRWQRIGAFAAGGVTTAFVTIGPVFGADFIRNVFTRTSTGGSIGGLGPFGIIILPLFNREWLFIHQHVAQVEQIGLLVTIGVAVLAGWWLKRSGDRASLISLSLLTMFMVVLATPVLNDQYVLWYFPLLVIAASGVLQGKRTWFVSSAIVLSVVCPLQVLFLLGPSELFAPMAYAFGWPSTGSIGHQWWILYQPRGVSTFLPSTLVDRLSVVLALVSSAAMALLLIALWTAERDRRATPIVHHFGDHVQHRRLLGVAIGTCVVVECFALIATAVVTQPRVRSEVSVSNAPHTALLKVASNQSAPLLLTGFAARLPQGRQQIYFYLPANSSCQSTANANVLGVLQSLKSLLGPDEVTTIGTKKFAQLVSNVSIAAHSVVIDVTGVLPTSLWGKNKSALLSNWMAKGGKFVWAGGVPEHFVASPNARCHSVAYATEQQAKHRHQDDALVPLDIITPPNHWYPSAAKTSSNWRSALGLRFGLQNSPLSIAAISHHHGLVLGTIDQWNSTNVAFTPVHQGGLLYFASGPDGELLGSDLARLLHGEVLDALGDPQTALATSKNTTLTVLRTPGTTAIGLVAIEDNPTSIWMHRELRPWPGR